MAAAKSPRRRHSLSEKRRRIVELALREGSSIDAIAREQGVHPNSLRQVESAVSGWKAQCGVSAGAANRRRHVGRVCARDDYAWRADFPRPR